MRHILVVDHYEAVGEGTKRLLDEEVDFQVTFLCSSEAALEVIEKQKFDVLLFDLDMPVIRGQEFVKKVAELDSDLRMMIFTGYDTEPFFHTFIELGVSGFVSKTASKEQLIAITASPRNTERIVAISCSLDAVLLTKPETPNSMKV
ncbi:MAG TPA: response regulator [Bacilli bacterium]|nr:response regulator [Bacilli bacterium]